MAAKEIFLSKDEIKLGQFLKFAEIIDSGGDTKWFLEEHDITVNGEIESRRGRKLHPGDLVVIAGYGSYKLEKETP